MNPRKPRSAYNLKRLKLMKNTGEQDKETELLDMSPWSPFSKRNPGETTKSKGFSGFPLLPRQVHWRGPGGKWVVVAGPFPDSFFRSETRDTPEKAAKLTVDTCYNRAGTTKDEAYAKVLAADILEIDSGENEFGTVSP